MPYQGSLAPATPSRCNKRPQKKRGSPLGTISWVLSQPWSVPWPHPLAPYGRPKLTHVQGAIHRLPGVDEIGVRSFYQVRVVLLVQRCRNGRDVVGGVAIFREVSTGFHLPATSAHHGYGINGNCGITNSQGLGVIANRGIMDAGTALKSTLG